MDCMRCRELVELVTDFMEGELSAARRAAVEAVSPPSVLLASRK